MVASLFGTDGIRGHVGENPITPEGFLKLGWSLGQVLKPDGAGLVVVGRDTRLSGSPLSLACISGLLSAGLDVIDCGVMPTPGIAYLTKTLNARAGVVVSASHNLYMDNGLKFFDHQGQKFSAQVEQTISHFFYQALEVGALCGQLKVSTDSDVRYMEHLKAQVPSLDLHGVALALDTANGATSQVAPRLFSELGAQVFTISNKPDGLNINDECGATNTERLKRCVRDNRCELGIALDGDGDRLIMVDHNGNLVDGDQLVFILAQAWHKNKRLSGGVVGTLMSNLGQEQAIKDLGVAYRRSNVGDVHVLNVLRENNWNLGGESSGHVICLDHATTGDGLLTALMILEVVQQSGKTLAELAGQMTAYPSILVNVSCKNPGDWAQSAQVKALVKQAEETLKNEGRVLIRASGTEPVIRVMVEGQRQDQIQALCDWLVSQIRALVCESESSSEGVGHE